MAIILSFILQEKLRSILGTGKTQTEALKRGNHHTDHSAIVVCAFKTIQIQKLAISGHHQRTKGTLKGGVSMYD